MTDVPDIAADQQRTRRHRELRSVIALSVPLVITTCSRMAMDIADFKMVSYLGADAQGAILPAQITLWTITVLGFVTVEAVNTFVSQCLGRQRLADASAYVWQGIYLAFLYGGFGLLLYPLLPRVFALIGHSPEIQRLELVYARIVMLGMGPTIAAEAMASFFNGIHRPRVSMWSALEANLLNIAVSLPLIFGWFGLPALGVAGAAWGTVAGVLYRLARLASVFLSAQYSGPYATRQNYLANAPKLRALLRVGLPQGLQAFSDVFVWAVFINLLIGRTFGDVHLVGTNVAWQYMRISFMPVLGASIALSALVGKAIGQRDPNQAIRLTRIAVTLILAYMTLLSLLYLIFRRTLIGWFNPDPQIVAIGSAVMVCACIFQVFDGLGIAYTFALRGAGDTFWPALITGVSHWSFVVGGGWVMIALRPQWGSLGPWSAATALLIFIGLALAWRWRSRAWQKIDIFRHERSGEAETASAS